MFNKFYSLGKEGNSMDLNKMEEVRNFTGHKYLIRMMEPGDWLRHYNAVSYTHLDVYKRQMVCTSISPFCSARVATLVSVRMRKVTS